MTAPRLTRQQRRLDTGVRFNNVETDLPRNCMTAGTIPSPRERLRARRAAAAATHRRGRSVLRRV